MTTSSSGMVDAFACALSMARDLGSSSMGMVGYGVVQRFDGDGRPTLLLPFANLVTDAGDLYYAGKAIAGVAPASAAAPTAVTGMQIGSGVGAPTKAGATSAIVTLLAGQAFDATFPSLTNLGTTLGVNAVHKTTYAPATGTGTVTEATITNGAIGTASVAANTIARVLFGSPVTKASTDTLAVTWNHKFLGT